MQKIVINKCFGGFSLSDAAYERLIELGVPVQAYIGQQTDPKTGLYLSEPANDGEVIFDRTLSGDNQHMSILGRYWETWLDGQRSHPLLLQVVKEMKKAANGACAELKIVTIPDSVEYEIAEYDGLEHVAEKHKTWS